VKTIGSAAASGKTWNKSSLHYLEGKVQLKQFYKKQSIKHILCSRSNNGAAFVPDSETSLCQSRENRPVFLVGLKMAACYGGKENNGSQKTQDQAYHRSNTQ
jgi:hypothetical protein